MFVQYKSDPKGVLSSPECSGINLEYCFEMVNEAWNRTAIVGRRFILHRAAPAAVISHEIS